MTDQQPPRLVTRLHWVEGRGYPQVFEWTRKHATFDSPENARKTLAIMLGLPSHFKEIHAFQAAGVEWAEVPELLCGVEPRPPLSLVENDE